MPWSSIDKGNKCSYNDFSSLEELYIVESNYIVRKVTIASQKGEFYTVWFEDGKGGIRLKEHRIFLSREAAEESIPQKEKSGYRFRYEYMF